MAFISWGERYLGFQAETGSKSVKAKQYLAFRLKLEEIIQNQERESQQKFS